MDQLSVISSDSDNSSCSYLTYEGTEGFLSDQEDPFFEIQDIAPPSLNTYQNRPSYEQILINIQLLEQQFPQCSIQSVVSQLHKYFVQQPKQLIQQSRTKDKGNQIFHPSTIPQPQQKKQFKEWLRKRNIAAEVFVELGYGITKMRKFVSANNINIQIDINTYNDIINKLIRDAYRRLEHFLSKKCNKKVVPINKNVEQKYLLELLKNCRNKTDQLDSFQIHNFFKLIKPVYIKDNRFKISKRIASRLYHSCKEYVSRKKVKEGYLHLDNPDCEIYSCSKDRWTEQMIEQAIFLYAKEASFNRVKQIMVNSGKYEEILMEARNVKYHIGSRIRQTLSMIEQSLNDMNTTLRMVDLNNERINLIANHNLATNARVLLCQIYISQQPTLSMISKAIQSVNQFISGIEAVKMNKISKVYSKDEKSLNRQLKIEDKMI